MNWEIGFGGKVGDISPEHPYYYQVSGFRKHPIREPKLN